MLDTLRKAAGTWVAKLLLLLLVVSFAIWGISGQLVQGFGDGTVASVGKTSVSAKDYRLAYDRQLRIWSGQLGRQLTREQATVFGLSDEALAMVVNEAALDEQVRRLGLGISRDHLAQLAGTDPAFAGPDGRFDRQQFNYVLREVGMSPDDYLRNRQKAAMRQQIVEALVRGLDAPDAFLNAVALYRGESRTVEFITLPRSLVEPVEEPADNVLSEWFEQNKADYRAPEYRKISYIRLEPADLADPSAIAEEQVAAYYEANKTHFTTPEKRTIEQIVFGSEEAADQARASLSAGSTFEDIVKSEGKTPEDVLLGTFTRDAIADKAIAEAAFVLEANETSPVITGAFGPVLLRVTQIEPQIVQPLDSVKEEIRRTLAEDEASRILLDVHDAYEDARAGGASMREAADKLKLNVVTIDAIDRSALTPDGTIVNDLPLSRDLLQAAFEAEANIENPPLNIGSNGFLFFEVDAITPARERTLDEVRDRVVVDWKTMEAAARLSQKASQLQERIDGGTSIDTIAAELSLEKQTRRGLTRESDDADLGKAGISAVFFLPLNGIGVTPSPDGSARILFKVTEVIEPVQSGPQAVPEELREVFASGLANDLIGQLMERLKGEFGIKLDREAATRALAF